MEKLYLRQAEPSDIDIFYAWRNEDAVRENSFNEDWVDYSNHRTWFIAALNNPREKMWLLCLGNKRIGQIRLTQKDDAYYLNYSVAHEYRGMGYGKIILQLAENEILDSESPRKIIAQVKKNNVASQRAFTAVGYTETRSEDFYTYEKIPVKQSVDAKIFNGGGIVLNK